MAEYYDKKKVGTEWKKLGKKMNLFWIQLK